MNRFYSSIGAILALGVLGFSALALLGLVSFTAVSIALCLGALAVSRFC